MLTEPRTAYDDHITMTPEPRTVRITIGEREVARTSNAIRFAEGDRPEVFYVPLTDVDLSLFAPSDHRTHCKWKGDASYRDADIGGVRTANIAWQYEQAHEEVAPIRNHVGFDLAHARVHVDE